MYTRRFLWSALLVSRAAWGQELLGVIRDPGGLPVGDAAIVATNAGTGLTRDSRTNDQGFYQFLALPAGEYRLAVARNGFAPLQRAGIVLRGGDRVVLDLEVALGDARQSVEVSGAVPLLVARGTVSFVAEQRQIGTLPLDGRNFVQLIALSPGVNLPPGSLLPRINGSRPRVSEYVYDGISVLQPEPGQVAFYPVIDAMAEFRVETNSYAAEYGRSNGGVILVHQKSGTNALHGTLFEFFRNETLNARNLFATALPKPRFRRNQYGFVLGGPVQVNRTFFFGDWQGTRLATGVVRTSNVPSEAEKRGVFAVPIFDPASGRRMAFADNTIPASRFDRAAMAVVNRYPAPNVAGAAGNNYRRIGNDQTAADQFDGRLDRYWGTRHRVFGRCSLLRDDGRPTAPLPDGSGGIGRALTRADGLAVEHTLTVGADAVNQVRFGFTRRRFDRSTLRGSPSPLIPNLIRNSFADTLPVYDLAGLQPLGPAAGGNGLFATAVVQFIDHYSRVRGRHNVKAGADIRLERLDVLQPANPTGNFQFTPIFTSGATGGSSLASFLLGQVSRFSIDLQQETIRPRARIAELFVQDDWRVSRRLTVNAGVRYTLNFPSTVAGDQGAVFNLATQKLDYLGANGVGRSLRSLEKWNFAPRLGVAYKVTDSLVWRAGYGITWIEQSGITTPFTTPLFPFVQTLGQQTLDNVNPAFVLANGPTVRAQELTADAGLGQGVFGVQRNNGSGYAQQWNGTLQKTFGEAWSVEAGYLGSKLTRLGVPDVNLNQLTVEQLGLGAALTRPVANPYFGQIPGNSPLGAPMIPMGQLLRPYTRFTTVALYRNNVGHSTYHSLQARVERRMTRGVTLTGAYTFSRLIDDAGAVFDSALLTGPAATFQAADSFNKRLEKDVSTGNIPHIVSVGIVHELRRGWRLAGIGRAQAGSPVAVTQATNFNAFAGFGIQRPNRMRPVSVSEPRVTRWFNTEAFARAGPYSIGTSSRNPVTGPGFRAVDVMVGKTIRLGERVRAEFRVEAFNVLNTPPLGSPNGSFGNAAFGTISTAGDPRVFEAVVKVQF